MFLALAEALLTIGQFDFSGLSGDLLGGLYQQHFDPETRKALGEFYTPGEAIEFILDQCGYQGQPSRLLDPSCGSGSFIAAALRRYLAANSGMKRTSLLADLTEGLRIVGFDINPFAVLMAQVNYAALILPAYADALREDPAYRILRLPIFRTDSLRIEDREEEFSAKKEKLTVSLKFEEDVLRVSVFLPLKQGKTRFAKLHIPVPRFEEAKARLLIHDLEEYITAMARVFQVVRDPNLTLYDVFLPRFGTRTRDLVTFLEGTLQKLRETVTVLKTEYNDGRFLKTIEDLVLAVSLKSDMKYDFVVGNPPYVRVQNIPAHVRDYWTDKYAWAGKNFDIFVPFIERSVTSRSHNAWLTEGGKLGFILSNRFENVDYAAEMRDKMPNSFALSLLLDMRDTRVFESAQNYPAIIIGELGEGGRDGEAVGARVFGAEVTFSNIRSRFSEFAHEAGSGGVARGDGLEVFKFERATLHRSGWWIMPEEERRIFDKLRAVDGANLAALTATSSGGFAGYQTSADPIFVLDEVEDLGDELIALPRFAQGTERPRPVKLEKAALRPFLFGKDVARWGVNWKRSWVIFPYDQYELNKGLLEKGKLKWELIPSKTNFDKHHYAHPEKIQCVEERFPKLWAYLLAHQRELRKREGGKYQNGKTSAEYWYEAAYPRGLEFYFSPKLVLQVLSSFPSFTIDPEGKFVFTAGGTAGVYGISLKGESKDDALRVAGFLNSAVADFCVKQISSVFGNKYYSYGDQFIAGLRVPRRVLESSEFQGIVEDTLSTTMNTTGLRRALGDGADGLRSEMKRFDFKRLSDVCAAKPGAKIDLDGRPEVIQNMFEFQVVCAGRAVASFQSRAHADLLAVLLELSDRKSLRASELLEMRLPETAQGAERMLQIIHAKMKRMAEQEDKRHDLEQSLNTFVLDAAKLTPSERKTLSAFLLRFSNGETDWYNQVLRQI